MGEEPDVFVTKMDPSGKNLLYSTYVGGSDADFAMGIDVDVQGAAYVTGYTFSLDFPTQNPFQADMAGGMYDTDSFILKLNPAGSSLEYSTYLGGSQEDRANAISVDANKCAYVTGETASSDFPTQNPLQGSLAGVGDIFVTKFNAAGDSLAYSTYLGGSDWRQYIRDYWIDHVDIGRGIAVDAEGAAYVTGETASSDFPLQNPIQNGLTQINAFVTKLTPSGTSLAYSTYLGGTNSDVGNGIALDSTKAVYVVGTTVSNDFPLQSPLQANLAGYRDVFVTKINSSGDDFVFSSYLGGAENDYGLAVGLGTGGDAYITGDTRSNDFPTLNPLRGSGAKGAGDAFVAKIDGSGCFLVYSTYLGGSGLDAGHSIGVDFRGAAWITGVTWSADFSDVGMLSGSHDAFFAKIIYHPYVFDGHDFNGDGISDLGIWRPSNGIWYIRGIGAYAYGVSGDIPVPGDYDGDGNGDIAVWRPSNGIWYIRGIGAYTYGLSGDIPVPGDYDGDGITDIAVWRPSNGIWYIRGIGAYTYGVSGDIPVPGDYDGDGDADMALWRPSNGIWYIKNVRAYTYGINGDIPVPADYDGDGITDIAVWRPLNGIWYIRGKGAYTYGVKGDIPVPGDYDGDGDADVALWRPSNGIWYIWRFRAFTYGTNGDIPLSRLPYLNYFYAIY
jgi:hypothetical protein